jgi:hypothetical protein
VHKAKRRGRSCVRPSFEGQVLKSSEDKPSSKIRIKAEKKFLPGEEHFIVCRNCGNTITTPESIISVNGEHLHGYTNPDGFEYEIGCFSLAEGCIIYGEPTLEHTWFEGFSWSLCMCSSCLIHNGWFYERKEESFFGLILDMIVDTTTTH